jgi:hypothetical protein
MNFIKRLQKSEGKDIIMLIVDTFTKHGHFIALAHSFLEHGVAQLFMDYFYKFYGLPTTMVTGIDKLFKSLFWRELFNKLRIKLLMSSTSYHPQTNGQLKRCITMHNPKTWFMWLSLIQ